MDPRKLLALVLGGVTLAAEGALLALGWGVFSPDGTALPNFLMIVVGGPVCLLAGLLLGLRWYRTAGAMLWLGGAFEAMGIAFRSGSMVGQYFLGLGLFVVPQILVGSLLLLIARDAPRNSRPR